MKQKDHVHASGFPVDKNAIWTLPSPVRSPESQSAIRNQQSTISDQQLGHPSRHLFPCLPTGPQVSLILLLRFSQIITFARFLITVLSLLFAIITWLTPRATIAPHNFCEKWGFFIHRHYFPGAHSPFSTNTLSLL